MHHRFSVLVIDDDASLLTMLRIMLTEKGFDVVAAQDALTGLRSAYETRPDAFLLDVMMPEMDGFEACRRLREFTDVPIIFVTAKGTIEDIVHGLSLGADDYLVKPFNHAELASRLMTCLRRGTKQTESESNSLSPTASMTLDCDRHEMLIGNRTVYLTPKEFSQSMELPDIVQPLNKLVDTFYLARYRISPMKKEDLMSFIENLQLLKEMSEFDSDIKIIRTDQIGDGNE